MWTFCTTPRDATREGREAKETSVACFLLGDTEQLSRTRALGTRGSARGADRKIKRMGEWFFS